MGGGLAAVVVVALLLTGGPSTRGPSETAGGPPENPAAAPAEVPVPRGPTAPAPKPGPALEGTAAGPAKAPESRAERERKAEETLGGILAAELAPCERITQLRDFCERESFAGTKAAARAKTELDALEKDYRRRATTAWREKEARAHEKEEQGACYEAWCICLAFQDEFPNTLEADNARSEGKRLERERDERWAETEGRIKSLLEAGEFDGVERLIAEVKRWGWPECNGKAEAYAARAARERLLRGEEGEEIVALPPGGEPSGPEAPGPGVPAPQDSPAPAAPGGPEGPGEPGPTAPEPGPGAPEPGPTPPEPGKTSTKPESPPTAFGATLEQLKEIFATDAVSIEDGRIVLKYQFGTLGGVNEELGADWTPKITHSRAAFVRWSEPWEGSIRRVFYGVRVSDNGRLEHMATWLADVEVTIRYLPAGQYRKGTFFAIGFHSDDKPTRWIGVNHGVQACRMQAAPRPTASGRVLAAEPAAARLPTVDHRYTMKMVLQGGTCGAYLNNRKRAEIGEREPLGKGKVGFIWWRSVVGTINSVEIKGKLDPAWVRDALGKGT